MSNANIISIFKQLRDIYSIKSNSFRSRSYDAAIKKLQSGEPLSDKMQTKVSEIRKTGRLALLDNLLQSDPKIAFKIELERVLGFGPKSISEYVDKRDITTIEKLRQQPDLTHLQRLGLKYYPGLYERIPRKEISDFLLKLSKKLKGYKVIPAGSYSRGNADSGDIDIILTHPSIKTRQDWDDKDLIGDVTKAIGGTVAIMGHNTATIIVETKRGTYRQVDVKIAPTELLEFWLLYFASGEEKAREMRLKAKQLGYKLNQWGLFKDGVEVPLSRLNKNR